MTCDRIREQMCDYLDGELDNGAAALFEEHLATCDVCRRETEELRETLAWIKKACAAAPPPNLRRNVISILEKEQAAKKRSLPGFRQAVAAAAVFVFLVAGNLLPVQLDRMSATPFPFEEKAGIMRAGEAPAAQAPETEDSVKILTAEPRSAEEAPPANESYAAEDTGVAVAARDYTSYRILLNLAGIPLFLYLLMLTFRKRREALR